MEDKIYTWYMLNKENNINEEYLYHTFELLLQENPLLSPYIENFQIIHSDEQFIGSYSDDYREIVINQQALENMQKNQHLYGINVIKHEMEHAKNLRTLEYAHNDIESLIVNYALKDYALKKDIDWHSNLDQLSPFMVRYRIKENYEVNPGERLAEIKSWKYLVNLLKNQHFTDDLLTARTMLYYSYVRGYHNNRYYLECPTYQFLLNTGMYHELYWLKNRVSKQQYNLETRLTYGLPITEKEYDEKILQKVLLRRVKK